MDSLAGLAVPLVERGWVPDSVVRTGIRQLLISTLNEAASEPINASPGQFAASLKSEPIAVATAKANQQHYEVSAEFYKEMLGPWFKYSSGLWPHEGTTLEESEVHMLNLVCERAELGHPDVVDVLDMGCGWGSCALFIAVKYPKLRVTCVSNSNSQREFILARAKDLGVADRVFPCTQDANVMTFPIHSFDRVVTTEMLEHMKNYELLFKNISGWLRPKGKMFVHIFTNDHYSYHFKDGWMAENFFTGGTMPHKDLLAQFQHDLKLEEQWKVNGIHYSKTLEAWLTRLDERKEILLPILGKIYGEGNEEIWWNKWRLFNMACSELFSFQEGKLWYVSHYRFVKR